MIDAQLSDNFHRSEFACECGCGFDTADVELVEILQLIRDQLGPVEILSGCRCKSHNADVGGSKNSQHMYGRAADIHVPRCSPSEVADLAESLLGNSGGLGRYDTFTHIDTRTGHARWEG